MNFIFHVVACVVLLASTVKAGDGTCTDGQDQLGVTQSCLGRCHVYNVGDYGACGDQVTSAMVSRNCGTSAQNACISTFNAGWDSSKSNCGNCYYVEMAYSDGTVNYVYLKTIDTNGSETKFEMMQYAWEKLCPHVCDGDGTCANKESDCAYGLMAEKTSYPQSCAVQNAPVTFKRVACDGSDDVSSVPSSSGSQNSSNNSSSGGLSNGSHSSSNPASSNTGASEVRGSNSSSSGSSKKSKKDQSDSSDSESSEAEEKVGSNPTGECRQLIRSESFRGDCQARCTYYSDNLEKCGLSLPYTGEALARCVASKTPYCYV